MKGRGAFVWALVGSLLAALAWWLVLIKDLVQGENWGFHLFLALCWSVAAAGWLLQWRKGKK